MSSPLDDSTASSPHGSNTRCPLCGTNFGHEKPTLDHVVPRAMGGIDREQVWVCARRNHGLGTKLEGRLLSRTV